MMGHEVKVPLLENFYADYYTAAGIALASCLAMCLVVGVLGRRGGLLLFMILTALASLLQLGLLNREWGCRRVGAGDMDRFQGPQLLSGDQEPRKLLREGWAFLERMAAAPSVGSFLPTLTPVLPGTPGGHDPLAATLSLCDASQDQEQRTFLWCETRESTCDTPALGPSFSVDIAEFIGCSWDDSFSASVKKEFKQKLDDLSSPSSSERPAQCSSC